jgi:hypothetical protein
MKKIVLYTNYDSPVKKKIRNHIIFLDSFIDLQSTTASIVIVDLEPFRWGEIRWLNRNNTKTMVMISGGSINVPVDVKSCSFFNKESPSWDGDLGFEIRKFLRDFSISLR